MYVFRVSESLLHALILGRNIHQGLIILACLWPMKYFNSFLPKQTLLDTTILLISRFFIEIGHFSIAKFSNSFHFYICFQKKIFLIYNFPLFPFKLEFEANLQLQNWF